MPTDSTPDRDDAPARSGKSGPDRLTRRSILGMLSGSLAIPLLPGSGPPAPPSHTGPAAARADDAEVHEAIDVYTATSLANQRVRDDPDSTWDDEMEAAKREFNAGHALVGAIRSSAGMAGVWGWARFDDPRPGGRTWLALPQGMVTRHHPSEFHGCTLPALELELKLGDESWIGHIPNLLVYDRDAIPAIDTRQLDFDGPEMAFRIGRDSIPRPLPRRDDD